MAFVAAAVATVASAIGFGTAAAAAIGTFVTRVVVGIGLSLLSQALAPGAKKPKAKQTGIQTEQTTTGDTTPQKFVVGRYGLEGHLVAPSYSRGENNKILTYILEVSNIPVTGLTGRVIINGQYAEILDQVPVGGSGRPGSESGAKVLSGLTDFDNDDFPVTGSNKAWIWFLDGTQIAALPHLVSEYGGHPDRPWTADHKLLGTAYAVLEFVFEREFFNGLPAIRFEVDGIRLYDPRKDSTVGGSGSHRWGNPDTYEFTQNNQVINYNVLRGITLPNGDVYGGGVPAEDLPLDNWFAAMNECDVLIGDRPQYQAGFEVDTNDVEPLELIEQMNRASFAEMSEVGGVFRVRVGAPAEPVMTLNDADFVITEPSENTPFPGLKETRNAITGTYVEPVDVWQGRSTQSITNAAWEAEDGDRRLWANVDMPAVANNSQAQQLLAAYIADDRRFRSHRMTLPPSFARIEPLDTIEWTSEINGYVEKLFEVVEVEDRPDTVQQTVRIRERDQGDVVWQPADDLPVPLARNGYTVPAQPVPVLTIPADSIVSSTRVIREAVQSVISFNVTTEFPAEMPVETVEAQFQSEVDDQQDRGWRALTTGSIGGFELVAPDVGTYRFRARTFGADDRPGPWATTDFIGTATLDEAPGDVADFFAEVSGGNTTFEWEPVAGGDLSYYLLRHAVETTGATWANATTAIPKIPRPGTSATIPARPGTYLIKAVSKTGVPAQGASTVVLTDADMPDFDQVLTDDQHTAFSGTKTGVEVDTNRLQITDPSSAPSQGTYDFAGYIETHDATVRRVRARIDATTIRLDEGGGTWTSIPGTWTTWPGTWTTWTDNPQFADTDIEFFIRATDDDPAGTPTWGDWRRFRVSEFRGRAFQFRAVLKSNAADVTPAISELTAVVEYNA